MTVLIVLTLTACSVVGSAAFTPSRVPQPHTLPIPPLSAHAVYPPDSHYLLDEFKTHTGEVLNPYRVLKVSRTANTNDIKQAYHKLSRRYHPDGVRGRDIMPGRCNNLDDVREEWERIKMSYEILKDRQTRRRYDRHEFLADPAAAMGRAALDVMTMGLVGLTEGVFQVGAFTLNSIAQHQQEKLKVEPMAPVVNPLEFAQSEWERLKTDFEKRMTDFQKPIIPVVEESTVVAARVAMAHAALDLVSKGVADTTKSLFQAGELMFAQLTNGGGVHQEQRI